MSRVWTKEKVEETLEMLYQRAAIDPEFRRLCLDDAAAALREVGGPELLDIPVRFVERLEEQVLVLPPLVLADELDELDELELERVAGGAEGVAGVDAAARRRRRGDGTTSRECRWTEARGTRWSLK